MEKIIFREPAISDVKSALEMINSLVKEKAYILAQEKLTLNEEKKFFKKLLKEIETKTRVTLIIDVSEKCCGIGDISLIDKGVRKHVGELGILLKKEIRGRGLGEKLLKKVIEKAHKELKVKIVTLYAYSKNKVAINLYKKMGFKKLGTIKKGASHYGKLMDKDIMVKYI
ncbi:MAG TPA: GNAT family protein [Candidatus Pacearchaeota archaeon]|nr:GNAT family protein [Candidatus Pacearchaeota archaeon]HPR80113.1 GNAT family protein [Candidatus Pacearchaeota archaeon]